MLHGVVTTQIHTEDEVSTLYGGNAVNHSVSILTSQGLCCSSRSVLNGQSAIVKSQGVHQLTEEGSFVHAIHFSSICFGCKSQRCRSQCKGCDHAQAQQNAQNCIFLHFCLSLNHFRQESKDHNCGDHQKQIVLYSAVS